MALAGFFCGQSKWEVSMAVGERGSMKWAEAHEIDPKELEELAGFLQEEGEILWWMTHGQPAFERLVGTARLSSQSASKLIQRVLEFESLRLQLLVHPIGVPQIDGVLVEFEH